MGSQQNKLENLKMVLFDFDDTLAVHSQGHRISDHLMKYMINVHSGSKELWNTSKPNLQLKKFMDYLAYKNIPMGYMIVKPRKEKSNGSKKTMGIHWRIIVYPVKNRR